MNNKHEGYIEQQKQYEKDDQMREHLTRMRLKHITDDVGEIELRAIATTATKTIKEINDELAEASNDRTEE